VEQSNTKRLVTVSHSSSAQDHARVVAARAAPTDYQFTLLKIIQATSEDPGRVRKLVYELARATLKKHIWTSDSGLSNREAQDCMQALETAIARVEEDSSRPELADARFPRLATNAMLLPVASPDELGGSSSAPRSVMISPGDGVTSERLALFGLPECSGALGCGLSYGLPFN
jgi:hypothetical protein